MPSGLATLVFREAMRLARRRNTWVLRLGFASFIAFFCLGSVDVAFTDAAEAGTIGRRVFETWASVQLVVVLFLAPLTVATGVQEERDAGTFDLLLLSGLSAPAVLWGQVASRLLSTLAILASGLPVLAISVSYGGVSPWEVVNTAVGVAVAALVLGSIAAYFALFARSGPLLPTLGALAWTVPMWVFLPAFRAGIAPGSRAWSTVVPLAAVFEASPAGLLVVLAALPPVVLCAAMGVPVFRMLLTDDAEEALGVHSPDIWVLERFRRWFEIGIAAFVVSLVPLGGATLFLSDRHPLWAEGVSWVWLVGVEGLGTLAFLFGGVWLYERLGWLRGIFVRRYDDDAPPPNIRFNPVWWRETTAASLAGSRWFVRLLGVAGLQLIWIYYVFGERAVDDLGSGPVTVGVYVVGGLVTPLVAALHQIEERRARTLPVLLVTVFPPWKIALGKLAAVWTRVGPWLLIGFIAWLFAEPVIVESLDTLSAGHGHPGPNLFLGTWWPRAFLGSLWYAALISTLAALTMAAALRAPAPRLAWATTAALYVAVPFLLLSPELLGLGSDAVEDWLVLWIPFADRDAYGCARGGLPPSLVVGVLWMVTLGALSFAWLTLEISRFRRDLD